MHLLRPWGLGPKTPRQAEFRFNGCFDSRPIGAEAASQVQVYEAVGRPLVDHAFKGYNACMLAYGQAAPTPPYTSWHPPNPALSYKGRGISSWGKFRL